MSTEPTYTLTIFSPDRVGIVAAVSGLIARHGGWILEANHYSDQDSNKFFMRHVIQADSLSVPLAQFRDAFSEIAEEFDLVWQLKDNRERKRVVLMVSKLDHCLSDFLHRWRNAEYDVEVPCVISNHQTLRGLVEWHGIPFHHVPVNKSNKKEAFEKVDQLYRENQGDVLVLARYMQIIPEYLCDKYFGQIINIHHSFLPSFVGAKPYHQAFDRGVKLIGATCHYITGELDAGPIIEQEVVRISHAHTPKDMVRIGKNAETIALARGLHYHLEDRVFVHQNRTIVLQ